MAERCGQLFQYPRRGSFELEFPAVAGGGEGGLQLYIFFICVRKTIVNGIALHILSLQSSSLYYNLCIH